MRMTSHPAIAGTAIGAMFVIGVVASAPQQPPTNAAAQAARDGAHVLRLRARRVDDASETVCSVRSPARRCGWSTREPRLCGRFSAGAPTSPNWSSTDRPVELKARHCACTNPQSRQWTLNYFNAADGLLTLPMTGEFRNGKGVFHGQDTLGGRSILVRFVITRAGNDLYRFEQSFSDDGGETWELNWVASDTKRSRPSSPLAEVIHDHQIGAGAVD